MSATFYLMPYLRCEFSIGRSNCLAPAKAGVIDAEAAFSTTIPFTSNRT